MATTMPQAVQISASVGIALSRNAADAHTLIEAADVAMYAAKFAGKDRYTFAVKSDAAGE